MTYFTAVIYIFKRNEVFCLNQTHIIWNFPMFDVVKLAKNTKKKNGKIAYFLAAR